MKPDQRTKTKNNKKLASLKKLSSRKQSRSSSSKDSPQKPKKVKLAIDKEAIKRLKLVAVAYSHIEREWFPTEEAYQAELEVEERAKEVLAELEKLGIPAKGYPGDAYFMTNLLVDKPDLVLNLVDTLRGKDALQTSVPAALELANIPYTGARLQGLVIGNDRNLVKQMMIANQIPTPDFQFIERKGTMVDENLGLPLIVKLNESGGSVGIDNEAVKETREEAQDQVDNLIRTYKMPVMVERFVNGLEITVVVLEDSQKKHVFLGQKVFGFKPDGKHSFTSLESYEKLDAYQYQLVDDPILARKINRFARKAYTALHNQDYAKFDVRVDSESGVPYFIDANPNTAFGPDLGLPMTEVLALHRVGFPDVLASLMSKYAEKSNSARKYDFDQERFTQINESYCGPAVIQMLLHNLGVEVTQQEVAEAGGASDLIEEQGMRVKQLERAVRILAPQTSFWYKDHSTIAELVKIVDDYDYPVGVEWQGFFEDTQDDETEDGDYGHYSVVTMVNPTIQKLVIADPYKDFRSQDRIFTFDFFMPRWWDMNECRNPRTGKKRLVEDQQMMFVITPADVTFPKLLKMKRA